jgi:hypothetical protein
MHPVRAARRAALGVVLATSGVMVACTGSHSPAVPTTPSVSAYLGGDIDRLPLTGDSRRPTDWTLLPAASSVQRELEVTTQRWEAFQSAVALDGGLKPALYGLYFSWIGDKSSYPSFSPDGPVMIPDRGIVWERVYVARQTTVAGQEQGRVIVCRDQRNIYPAAKGTSTAGSPPHVSIYVYLWSKRAAPDPEFGRTPRWRPVSSDGNSVPLTPAECNAWAKTHTVWNGPSAG